MRAALMLAVFISIASWANATPVDPAEAWRPFRPFIGTWKGTRTGAEGPVKVVRGYASAPANHHLEITEKGGKGGPAGVWGVVSLDPQRQVLVLRHFAADGSTSDVALVPETSTAEQLVFASPESEPTRTRITDERSGARNFIERVERSAGGGPFVVVSETRFVRQD